MHRRQFLAGMLAAAAAPAFVRPQSLMRIKPIVLPPRLTLDQLAGLRSQTFDLGGTCPPPGHKVMLQVFYANTPPLGERAWPHGFLSDATHFRFTKDDGQTWQEGTLERPGDIGELASRMLWS